MKKEYIYIVQARLESSKCKIGKTNDLERRLKEYNSMTGKSKENTYQYLFCSEVKDMSILENDIKKKFSNLREEKSKEIYTKSKEEILKKVKIVKKTTPTLKERGLSRKDILQKAQKVNNDEFYTRMEDIEKELSMYNKKIWKNKTVFCNCDDAVGDDERNTSAFALYFLRNFIELKLKKLICTHYDGPVDLFNQGSKAYVFTKDGFLEKKFYPKHYTGSFDDPLSLKILKEEADIVCTNPPFSRAIDYWKILIDSGKKFIIISNFTNVLTPAYIPYFQNNQVWAGFNRVDYFLTPKKELTMASGHWYTNFKIKNRPKYKNLKIMPLKEIPEKYKKYDDSKILLVNNNYIPSDYKKPFAVSAYPILSGILEKNYKIYSEKEYFPYINKKRCFGRVLIKKY